MQATDFDRYIDECERRLESESLRPVMEECLEQGLAGERYMFQTQTAPDGEVWPRRTHGTSQHPILNLTGALMAAATGGPGSVREVGDRYCVWGVRKQAFGSLAGAKVHQYGAVIRPRVKRLLSWVTDGVRYFAKQVTIPARPYVGLPLEYKENCREIIGQGTHEKVFQR